MTIRRVVSFWILVATYFLLVCGSAFGQGTTYTQTTHSCSVKSCSDAQFTPAATMTYIDGAELCGDQNFTLHVTWNGVEYTDGVASINFLGYVYQGKNYYPFAIYELRGTFNNGTMTLVEHTKDYRGCSSNVNIDGSVTVN